MSTDSPTFGGPSMVKIDGNKIRMLRESLELTQLYLATAVGVTTDTISRWENRRYPGIKRENAVKLAEALEVSLAEILEEQKAEAQDSEAEESRQEPVLAEASWSFRGLSSRAFFLLALISAVVLCGILWWYFSGHEKISITAYRFLPPHSVPGQAFPVVINVETDHSGSLSLILRESVPQQCTPIKADPIFTAVDDKTGDIKWIYQTDGEKITFCYLAEIDPGAKMERELRFDGAVTVRKGRGAVTPTRGSDILQIRPLHWADANGDGKIDDEEILTVYDEFGPMKDIDIGIRQIEDIWSGNGYRWDEKTKKFMVMP